MNNLNLITQYDPEKDETSCILNMIYNKKDLIIPINEKPDLNENEDYNKLYQQNIINNNPSLFIFVLDQSGSMAGQSMEIAKKTLIFFLQSLPKNSYYHLIGFGSNFEYIYSENPVEYLPENVNETIKKIENLDADLGGTELLKPLKEIYESKKYDNINLCRNLFILTDGYVEDKYECLKLIQNNSNLYRIHSFGIGNSFDKDFIKNAGKKGSFNFINDVSKLKMNVIQILNKTLQSYLFDIKINIKDIQKEHEFIPKDKIYYQDEPINNYFIIKNKISDDKIINIETEYYDKNELIKKEFVFDKNNIFKEKDGNIISKIIIGNILNNNELPKEKDIELALKYQILSKYTSLYAEMENENNNKNLLNFETIETKTTIVKKNNYNDNDEDSSSSDSDKNSSSSDSNNIKMSCKMSCKRKINKCVKRKCKKYSDSESDEIEYKKDKKCKKEEKSKKIMYNDDDSYEKEEYNKSKMKKNKTNKKKEESEESEKNEKNDESEESEDEVKCKKNVKYKSKKYSDSDKSDEEEYISKSKKNLKKKCNYKDKLEISSEDYSDEEKNEKEENKLNDEDNEINKFEK